MRSIRARLLGWLFAGVLLVGVVGGLIVYRNALLEADAFFDYHLRQTALILRDEPVEYSLAQQLPSSDAAYDFVVQVWTLDGLRIYLSRPHSVLPNTTTLGFSTVSTNEGLWRVFGAQARTKVIQVAQPMRIREQQAVDLALKTLRPFALLLPVLGILIWIAVGSALQPLQRLTTLVKARHVNALDPLPNDRLPEEVRPLVDALNELLVRLGGALDRERAFMADAAHELRTPLTALHLQMGTLARAANEVERNDAMEQLSAGMQRAIRLVEQMLSLARQEPRVEPSRVPVPLADIARDVVTELVPLADAKQIDLGISSSQPETVLGDPDALRTLTRNLVDNAVRYTPAGGRVTCRWKVVAHRLELFSKSSTTDPVFLQKSTYASSTAFIDAPGLHHREAVWAWPLSKRSRMRTARPWNSLRVRGEGLAVSVTFPPPDSGRIPNSQ